ncbi:MAG: hypothetical protein ACRC3A_00630 [Culicoidibacterales bacterium]
MATQVALTTEQLRELVQIVYPVYEQATIPTILPLLSQVPETANSAFDYLVEVVHELVTDPLNWQFCKTFPKATHQDELTFARLCRTYPVEVVQFALKSVCGKS